MGGFPASTAWTTAATVLELMLRDLQFIIGLGGSTSRASVVLRALMGHPIVAARTGGADLWLRGEAYVTLGGNRPKWVLRTKIRSPITTSWRCC